MFFGLKSGCCLALIFQVVFKFEFLVFSKMFFHGIQIVEFLVAEIA